MARMKKQNKCKGWQEFRGTGTFTHCCKNGKWVAAPENSSAVPEKVNVEFLHDPTTPLLCKHRKGLKTGAKKKKLFSSSIINNQKSEPSQISTANKWIHSM